jgi:hypothetical protein
VSVYGGVDDLATSENFQNFSRVCV